MEKEVYELWKEIEPLNAFSSGLKQYAGTIWIPSHANIRHALTRIQEIYSKSDETTQKFLTAMRKELMMEEPHNPPGTILNAFFNHLTIEGIKQKHMLMLAEQSVNYLAVQEHILEKKWPIEQQIFTIQQTQGAKTIIETIKKKCNTETKEALTALQKRLEDWKQKTTQIKLTKNNFEGIYPLLKKSKGPERKDYREIIKDLYDYLETPEEIEQKATTWIEQELPEFKKITQKIAHKYKCKPTVEEIEKAIDKNQHIPAEKLLQTVKKLKKPLHELAKNWLDVTPKYYVKTIETPEYLVPFLPTAAMQPFNALTKPFCISFVTTNKKANPSTSLPELIQTTIHEEYGHCVNFLNSYNSKIKLIEKLPTTLETPITEGIAFNRERESLKDLQKPTEKFKKIIEKYTTYPDFLDAITFVIRKWRMIRFLRAVSDVRINLGKQNFTEFIEWAHKKTGISKKIIFDQTFSFQENPGYAPCYSIFGQKIKEYQQKISNIKEFNTFIASRGFPARSILEKEIKKKFNL